MQAVMFFVILLFGVMTDGIVAEFGLVPWAIAAAVIMVLAWRSLEWGR